MSRLGFSLDATATGSQARAGRFRTLHNEVLTPLFMPVATLATVRAQKNEVLRDSGAQVLLANTFHLLQRPGVEVFEKFGGIHRFMNWGKSVLTDSGGFQIFSLSKRREMKEDGAWFRTFDGAKLFLSPETSIATQKAIGSDIMMVLDECIDATAPREQAARAMQLTHRWAARSLEARGDSPQALFGIVQGACYDDLRVESAQTLRELPFDGIAIGGLAVGEPREERERVVGLTTPHLPAHLPRYLMGVGTPIDLLEAVHRGVDMFDCILPTAFAQQGMAFTSRGKLGLRRGVYRFQKGPLDPACDCPTCATYDRAYVSHLIKSREYQGWHLVGQHNLYFYRRLMSEMRSAILENRFADYYRAHRELLASDDLDHPVKRPVAKAAAEIVAVEPVRGDYRIIASRHGHSSIQQLSSGETMHSVSQPLVEANRLYVEQAKLRERLLEDTTDELVVWDVGLGAGANAMAVVLAWEALAAEVASSEIARIKGIRVRPLRLVSFERDLDSFHLARSEPARFEYLKHDAPHVLARRKQWTSSDGRLTWELRVGDFLTDGLASTPPSPDVILYDPFSFKVDAPLWSVDAFENLLSATSGKPATLFTYSNSTLVRGRLLAAGWFVGRGVGTGAKEETTIASSQRLAGLPYLGGEFVERWRRSHTRVAELDERVIAHRQFRA